MLFPWVMKYTHKIRALVVSLVLSIFFGSQVMAAPPIPELGASEDLAPPLKEKSKAVAVVLGLDVIPGDALFYAGKPGQAIGNIGLFLGGAAMIYVGGVFVVATALGSMCDEGYECKQNTSDRWMGGVGAGMLYGGVAALLGSVIWEIAGGISGVNAHNREVRQQRSAISNIQPIISVAGNGGLVGASFNF